MLLNHFDWYDICLEKLQRGLLTYDWLHSLPCMLASTVTSKSAIPFQFLSIQNLLPVLYGFHELNPLHCIWDASWVDRTVLYIVFNLTNPTLVYFENES
jgi:hypothetical protein